MHPKQTESSKWNRSVPVFNEEDLAIFIGDEKLLSL